MAEEEKNEHEQPEAEAPAEAEAESEAPAEEPPTEEAPAEEPAAAEAPTEEPAAEAEGAPAEGEAADEGTVAEAPQEIPRKKKRKRMPRSQRRRRPKVKRERPAERRPLVRLPKPERVLGRRQERRGVVVSDAMDKTIVVRVEQLKMHPQYKKVIRRATKFHAHDEQNAAKVGDVVRIVETRPLSRTKCWRLAEIVEVAK
jgi:small subunit ribosomal protein S17